MSETENFFCISLYVFKINIVKKIWKKLKIYVRLDFQCDLSMQSTQVETFKNGNDIKMEIWYLKFLENVRF